MVGLVSLDCHSYWSIDTGWRGADSGAAVSSIHRRSACRRLTDDAAVRTARRPVGTDQRPVARARRLGRGDRGRQSVVCRGRALSLPDRDAVARSAGAARGLEERGPTLTTLGPW